MHRSHEWVGESNKPGGVVVKLTVGGIFPDPVCITVKND